jgi:CubicO group peptidase (beta-lactamase class C family)
LSEEPAAEIGRAFRCAMAALDSFSSSCWFPPAVAVVAVGAQGPPLVHVAGKANIATGREATAETPFYIASQTKAFVGLTAARLDEDGTVPMELALSAVWPALTLPPPIDPGAVTLRDLLTHQVPLLNDELVLRTSYEAEVPAGDYPRLLAAAHPRAPGFRYDNLGYLIYAAALEARTGRSWKTMLEDVVLSPMGLRRTSARTSAFVPDELAWRHLWDGRVWQAQPPKPDALMHAAGGLMASPGGMAAWLQSNLRHQAPGLAPHVFRCAQAWRVAAVQEDGPFHWHGYGLGQQLGEIEGVPVLGHRGGYEGARSIAVFSEPAGAGLAIMTNSDFGTRELIDRLCAAFFGALGGESAH